MIDALECIDGQEEQVLLPIHFAFFSGLDEVRQAAPRTAAAFKIGGIAR